MSPDGWVLVVPMLPSGVNVYGFRDEGHAKQIFNSLGAGSGAVLKALYFVADERE